MKKRFIVLSSLITILLASFPVVIFADETAQDSSNLHTLSDGVLLDQYFYDNYDLLPYLESDGHQRINTGINISSELKIDLTFSDLVHVGNSAFNVLYGGWNNYSSEKLALMYNNGAGYNRFCYMSDQNQMDYIYQPYSIMNTVFDKNSAYFNSVLIHSFTYAQFNYNKPLYIFAGGDGGLSNAPGYSQYKLYKFSIFDYSLNDGEGGYVRYYYPAKSKASETLGLYDAVSKTFFVTDNANYPFVSPTDDEVMNFQIDNFVTSGLGWIGDILDFVIETPIILFFFAVALAGSVYRWARRVVHF